MGCVHEFDDSDGRKRLSIFRLLTDKSENKMEVEVTVDGRKYVADFHEVDGAVTVITEAGGMETTTLGGARIESIARTILLRMVQTGMAQPKAE